jgi:coproporphyrinogen III oxidase-like Fe-S oxidoreductase
MPALYIHIPFCARRCRYCDFNTYAGLEALWESYVAALSREIRSAGEAAGRPPVGTIFIGGGTPTVLPPALLAQVLEACTAAFDVSPSAEITCEANPGTADQERFAVLRALGANRLSLGVQSFDDRELRWLGRIHTAADAERAFSQARAAGFENINLDLIFGLPERSEAGIRGLGEEAEADVTLSGLIGGAFARQISSEESAGLAERVASPARRAQPTPSQGLLTWQRTLARAVGLSPEHLSLYSLTVERGTPLGREVRRGRIPAPDDDLAADLYQAACDLLAAQGYLHYEVSSWARSAISDQPSAISYACRHNLVYWHRQPYLGFGAGAHSFDGERRGWNVRAVPRYIERLQAGRLPRAGGERIDRRTAMGETMMLGLRLLEEGVSYERFRAQFGLGPEDAFGAEIAGLTARGLLERLPDRLRLTPAGVLLGNRVFAEFMDDD